MTQRVRPQTIVFSWPGQQRARIADTAADMADDRIDTRFSRLRFLRPDNQLRNILPRPLRRRGTVCVRTS